MIIQSFEQDDSPIFWDQATGVNHYRSKSRPTPEARFVHTLYDFDLDQSNKEWRVVIWNDRATNDSHALVTGESVFILNDEGKTFVRV